MAQRVYGWLAGYLAVGAREIVMSMFNRRSGAGAVLHTLQQCYPSINLDLSPESL